MERKKPRHPSADEPTEAEVVYRTTRRIEWADTDAAGIAHFTSFFRHMEEAEYELLRESGLSVSCEDQHGTISWPRVSVRCDFFAPVKFGDVVDIVVSLDRVGEKSVTYHFVFLRDGHTVADGEITAACCRIEADQPPRAIPVPDWFRRKLSGDRD